jgi:hypothetical protein
VKIVSSEADNTMCDDKAVKVEVEAAKKVSQQNHRALYGTNGVPGLITEVQLLKKAVDKIATNDLPHMKAELMDEIGKLQEKTVMWPALGKGFLAPIVMAVIIAVTTTFVLKYVFP